MNHNDHVDLLKPANLPRGGVWADFGAGSGAFTLALRELIGSEGKIYAVDKNRNSLDELARAYTLRFRDTGRLSIMQGDFAAALQLPPLDGILMANSLHYFKDKVGLLRHARERLKPAGILLLVEYNVDRGNPWVPYPISFDTYQAVAAQAGFAKPRLLATHPSSFLREFYAAGTQPA